MGRLCSAQTARDDDGQIHVRRFPSATACVPEVVKTGIKGIDSYKLSTSIPFPGLIPWVLNLSIPDYSELAHQTFYN